MLYDIDMYKFSNIVRTVIYIILQMNNMFLGIWIWSQRENIFLSVPVA